MRHGPTPFTGSSCSVPGGIHVVGGRQNHVEGLARSAAGWEWSADFGRPGTPIKWTAEKGYKAPGVGTRGRPRQGVRRTGTDHGTRRLEGELANQPVALFRSRMSVMFLHDLK